MPIKGSGKIRRIFAFERICAIKNLQHLFDEVFCDPAVGSQFRMERHCQLIPLTDGGYPAVVFSQDFYARQAELYLRSPDKTHWYIFHSTKITADEKTAQLSAVSIASDRNLKHCQGFYRIIQQLFGKQYGMSPIAYRNHTED